MEVSIKEEGNVDYESDSEEEILPWRARRKEASSNEEDDDERNHHVKFHCRVSYSDLEGQGGCSDYVTAQDEADEEEFVEVRGREEERNYCSQDDDFEMELKKRSWYEKVMDAEGTELHSENQVDEKKGEICPVPTSGSFYMHDDRSEVLEGQWRYPSQGQKLWQGKVEQKWEHDRFEDMDSKYTDNRKENKNIERHYRSHRNRVMDHVCSGESELRAYAGHQNQHNISRIPTDTIQYKPIAKNNYGTVRTETNRDAGEATLNIRSGRVSTLQHTSRIGNGIGPLGCKCIATTSNVTVSTQTNQYPSRGPKLRKDKADQKWEHDKFEAIDSQLIRSGKEKKKSRSHYRAWNNRVMDDERLEKNMSKASAGHPNQHHTPRTMRMRGPKPFAKNNYGTVPTKTNQFRDAGEVTLNSSSGKLSTQNSQAKSGLATHMMSSAAPHAFRMSASAPPVYPSRSTSQDISVTQTRDVWVGNTNNSSSHSIMTERNSLSSLSTELFQQNTSDDTNGQNENYMLISPVSKNFTNMQFKSPGSSPNMHSTSSSQRSSAIPVTSVFLPGLGYSNTIVVAMKYQEGIICAADSKVTRADDPDFSTTALKMHKIGDEAILMMLGNGYQCYLLLYSLRRAILSRANNGNPPYSLQQITRMCRNILHETNEREYCGPLSRVIICGYDSTSRIYIVRSNNRRIEEVDGYVIGGFGSRGLTAGVHFTVPPTPHSFSRAEAMRECAIVVLNAIDLHPQSCGKPVWVSEITENNVVEPYEVLR